MSGLAAADEAGCRHSSALSLLARDQSRPDAGTPVEVGADQGRAGGGHRRHRPPRLAGGVARQAGTGGGGAVSAQAGTHRGGRRPGAGGVPGQRALSDRRRDQQHLQEVRPRPQGAQRRLRSLVRSNRAAAAGVGEDRQHPLRRAPDPGPRQPRPARDRAADGRPLPPDSGPHLDPMVFDSGLEVGFRLGAGVLRRPDAAYLRRGDRAVVRSADELARLSAGRLHADLQLGRPFAAEAGAGSDPIRHRAELRRVVRRAAQR